MNPFERSGREEEKREGAEESAEHALTQMGFRLKLSVKGGSVSLEESKWRREKIKMSG